MSQKRYYGRPSLTRGYFRRLTERDMSRDLLNCAVANDFNRPSTSFYLFSSKNKCSLYFSGILVPDRQEAQLSQRDRATLRVIEYFAKSLKVIRNDTVE